jgi:hypothetical protein
VYFERRSRNTKLIFHWYENAARSSWIILLYGTFTSLYVKDPSNFLMSLDS